MKESSSVRERSDRMEYAIVGMAGRFPGAPDIDAFWENLRAGVESRTVFTDEDLLATGVPRGALNHPRLVRSGFVLDGYDLFDASFFGLNPREAELLDPQHRIFLECAWETLEHAGCDPAAFPGRIGLFGGATLSGYLMHNVYRNAEVFKNVGGRQAVFGSVPDYMVTRVAYKLDLRGPACFVQSACSTSLVAVHLACQSLERGECDLVLAGGVSVMVPHRGGYLYEEGGMMSPDGICRTFDWRARGTVFGSGVGMVALKRLGDALAANDTIHAVVKGTAVNNDGSLKVGFTAPGVAGQARVIAEALATANVPAESVNYVEAHGTGTELGDPIEIAALARAFRGQTDRRGFCAVGSVKPNIGHLDAAAGVSSLIKTVLALKHRQIPPTINFEKLNPKIELEDSPFFINTELRAWENGAGPRRAGVSSFGFGGTNAHVIVEEAPALPAPAPSRAAQLLLLSARSEAALDAATARLADALQRRPQPLADVAFTLATGRRHFVHRRAVVCAEGENPAEALHAPDPRRSWVGQTSPAGRTVVFMFPGQGSQHVGMAQDLYRGEPLFRSTVDECAEGFREHLGADIREVMFAGEDAAAAERLTRTAFAQAALFTVEYALARLWMSWGIVPGAMIGHSIGELVAACLAGVFELPDALRLVALRGRLMEQMPPGTMLAVPLPAQEVQRRLSPGVWLAAANTPSLCVVSGEPEAIEAFAEARRREGIECRRLHTSHAFHSGLMDAAVAPFTEAAGRASLKAPSIPFVSNVTGTWIAEEEATSPSYWGGHIRRPVAFADGVAQVLAEPDRVLLEVGPGNTLSTLVRQQASAGGHLVIASMRHPQDRTSDVTTLAGAVGRLWVSGVAADWNAYYAAERRRHVPLPSYPFERQRFWIEPDRPSVKKALLSMGMLQRDDFADWFHLLSWKRSARTAAERGVAGAPVLLFESEAGACARLAERFAAAGRRVLRVRAGSSFARGADAWTVNPASRDDHAALLQDLQGHGGVPGVIVHAWGLTGRPEPDPDDAAIERLQLAGFYSLLYLAQAIGSAGLKDPIRLIVITDGVQEVVGGEPLVPEKAAVVGPCRVISQEFPNVVCRHVDLAIGDPALERERDLDALVAEALSSARDAFVAYRGGRRWLQTCGSVRLEPAPGGAHPRLRDGGVYLITGGFGGIGQVLAEQLASRYKAKLVLTGRRPLPPRAEWDALLAGGTDEAAARRIRTVQKLEALGADVLAGEADVTDEPRMRAVVADARARFGRIDGVIHAAGIAGGGVIQLKKREVAAAVLAPKVHGTRVLARILKEDKPGFLLLCSSMASLVGGFGQVDYCAANACLDTFARQFADETGVFTVSVNWNAWREVGMAVDTSVPEDVRDALKGAMLSTGITNAEGIDAFLRILAGCPERQVAVSPNDLELLGMGAALPDDQTVSVGAAPASSAAERQPAASAAATYHARPSLQTAYVAPRTDAERKIGTVWQDLLGIDRVGVNDNFFELGGHSLLAIRVMARVNEIMKTDIPVAKLYDGLTVAFLASLTGTTGSEAAPVEEEPDDAERRRDRARRQREQQARRREAMREMTRT